MKEVFSKIFSPGLETEAFLRCAETLKKKRGKKSSGHLLHISFSLLTRNHRPVNHSASFRDVNVSYAYSLFLPSLVFTAYSSSAQKVESVATCSARKWERHYGLDILSSARSCPVWSRTMTARRDPASLSSGTALSSESPATVGVFFLKKRGIWVAGVDRVGENLHSQTPPSKP